MAAAPETPPAAPSSRWDDARRIESWAGEIRVNLVRTAAVSAFYGHLLIRAHALGQVEAGGAYLRAVTVLVAAWVVLIVGLHQALRSRYFPGWLKYASTGSDLLLVTLLLTVAGGPRSPLAVLYLLVLATTALRLSLRLVWAATAGTLVLYLGLVAWTIQARPDLRIAHPDQVIFMLAVVAVGGVAGQMVRQARRLVTGGAVAVAEGTGP